MKTLTVLIAIALVLIVDASGQDRDKLRQQYGAPVGEVYRAAADVILITSLDKNNDVCSIKIEHQSHGTRLTDAELNAVLEKVAPKADRGAYVIGTFQNVTCLPDNDCAGVSESYTRLYITKIGSTNEYRYASVRYRRPECDEPQSGNGAKTNQ